VVADSSDREFWINTADPKGLLPDERAMAQERAALVRAAIDELSDNQRAALLLYRFEGMSYQEVARVMGLTLEAVRSLLVRARKNLRQRLAPLLGAERPLSEGARTK
jgi:RNA polymerase sigma-70 factor (ECF subfamily)